MPQNKSSAVLYIQQNTDEEDLITLQYDLQRQRKDAGSPLLTVKIAGNPFDTREKRYNLLELEWQFKKDDSIGLLVIKVTNDEECDQLLHVLESAWELDRKIIIVTKDESEFRRLVDERLYQLNARNGSAERIKARLDLMLLPSSRLEARPLAPLDRYLLPTPIMTLAAPSQHFFEKLKRGKEFYRREGLKIGREFAEKKAVSPFSAASSPAAALGRSMQTMLKVQSAGQQEFVGGAASPSSMPQNGTRLELAAKLLTRQLDEENKNVEKRIPWWEKIPSERISAAFLPKNESCAVLYIQQNTDEEDLITLQYDLQRQRKDVSYQN